MAEAATITKAGSERVPDSERVRLARAALDAALSVPGVRSGDAGPMRTHHTTAGKGERLDGVTCIADGRGGYEVSLQLVCEAVPLAALSAQIQRRVTGAADLAGLAGVLTRISVHFSDLAVALVP